MVWLMLLSGIQLPPDACGYWAHILSQCSLLRVLWVVFEDTRTHLFSLLCSAHRSVGLSLVSALLSSLMFMARGREFRVYLAPVVSHVHPWPITLPVKVWGSDWLRNGSHIHLRVSGGEQIEDYELELERMWFPQEKPWIGAGANAEDTCLPQSALLIINYMCVKK